MRKSAVVALVLLASFIGGGTATLLARRPSPAYVLTSDAWITLPNADPSWGCGAIIGQREDPVTGELTMFQQCKPLGGQGWVRRMVFSVDSTTDAK